MHDKAEQGLELSWLVCGLLCERSGILQIVFLSSLKYSLRLYLYCKTGLYLMRPTIISFNLSA